MRTAEEMYGLILGFAQQDERVRAVGLNGSRVNKNLHPDEFQDFDVVFLVEEMSSFLGDSSWVDCFGQRVIMQMPEAMNGGAPAPDLRRFAYLMQLSDGNRIDLSLRLVDDLEEYLGEDSLVEILLDKDGRVEFLPTPSEKSHFVVLPSAEDYANCHNEFWWVATYVAKGLCRGELLYAMKHMHDCVLKELLQMIGWAVGCEHGFQINLGHSYKFLGQYLSVEDMEEIYGLYELGSIQRGWKALFESFGLMKKYSKPVESFLDYDRCEDGKRVWDYVKKLYEKHGGE